MDDNKQNFLKNLDIIATVPNLLRENKEEIANTSKTLLENNKKLENIKAEFSQMQTTSKELLNALNTLDTQQIIKLIDDFKNIAEPIRKDLKSILLKELIEEIKPQLKELVFEELKNLIDEELRNATKGIITNYQYKLEKTFSSESEHLVKTIESTEKEVKSLNTGKEKLKEDIEELIKGLDTDRNKRKQMIEEDKKHRELETRKIEVTANSIEKKLDEYSYINSAEYHIYNTLAQGLFSFFLAVAGFIAKWNILVIIALALFGVFKGFTLFKILKHQKEEY